MPESFADDLDRRVSRNPDLRAAFARAVADEDVSRLAGLLRALGLDGSRGAVERFLDAPGPFLPFALGWT